MPSSKFKSGALTSAPRPESVDISEALKPAKGAYQPPKSESSFMDRAKSAVREAAHKAENFVSGGAIGTVGRATKNMDYGMGGGFNHAHEDDGK